jgi:hypothetical protein
MDGGAGEKRWVSGFRHDLEAVIGRCLEKDPADRFPDVMSLHQALAACLCANHWTEAAAAEWWKVHPINQCSSENA